MLYTSVIEVKKKRESIAVYSDRCFKWQVTYKKIFIEDYFLVGLYNPQNVIKLYYNKKRETHIKDRYKETL